MAASENAKKWMNLGLWIGLVVQVLMVGVQILGVMAQSR